MKKRKTKPTPLHLQVKFLRQSVAKLWEVKALQDKVHLSQGKINDYQSDFCIRQQKINNIVVKVAEDLMKLVEIKTKRNHSACSLFFWTLIALLFWKWGGV